MKYLLAHQLTVTKLTVFFLLAWPFLVSIGTALEIVHEVVGLEPYAIAFYVALFFVDWITGLWAAKYRTDSPEKGRIVSGKMFNSFFDLGVFTILLAALHIFEKRVEPFTLMDVELNWMGVVKWFLFSGIVLTQMRSILENRKDSGSGLAAALLRVMDMVFFALSPEPVKKLWEAITKKKAPKNPED